MKKQIVEVESVDYGDGCIRPVVLRWPDGRQWKISRTLHVSTPTENEFEGIRYTVLIGSAEKYIYRLGSTWYVEPLPMEVNTS